MRLKGLSLKDFAIVISDYLIKNGIEVILTGGACVSIYTDNKYISYDLDFVLISLDKQKLVKKLLLALGFSEKNKSFWHSDIEYFIELVPPPLSVGEEPVKEIFEIKKGNHKLKLLSPTECVKDRLLAFYHWDDRQCLEQAILVCKDNKVDLEEIKRWSINEGMSSKYDIFLAQL